MERVPPSGSMGCPSIVMNAVKDTHDPSTGGANPSVVGTYIVYGQAQLHPTWCPRHAVNSSQPSIYLEINASKLIY